MNSATANDDINRPAGVVTFLRKTSGHSSYQYRNVHKSPDKQLTQREINHEMSQNPPGTQANNNQWY